MVSPGSILAALRRALDLDVLTHVLAATVIEPLALLSPIVTPTRPFAGRAITRTDHKKRFIPLGENQASQRALCKFIALRYDQNESDP